MRVFGEKVKAELTCPRCNGVMYGIARVAKIELQCETCDSILSVEYVQGWHDGRKSQSAQHSVHPTGSRCPRCDGVMQAVNRCIRCGIAEPASG